MNDEYHNHTFRNPIKRLQSMRAKAYHKHRPCHPHGKKSAFKGKNRSQRQTLHGSFNLMNTRQAASKWDDFVHALTRF